MSEETGNSPTEQVSWNLSDSIIKQIGNLLISGTQSYMINDFTKCIKSYGEIRQLVVAGLDKPARKKLGDIKKNFDKSSNYLMLTSNHKSKYKKERLRASNLMNIYLDQYRDTLMDILDELGYLVQKKIDTSRMFDN